MVSWETRHVMPAVPLHPELNLPGWKTGTAGWLVEDCDLINFYSSLKV